MNHIGKVIITATATLLLGACSGGNDTKDNPLLNPTVDPVQDIAATPEPIVTPLATATPVVIIDDPVIPPASTPIPTILPTVSPVPIATATPSPVRFDGVEDASIQKSVWSNAVIIEGRGEAIPISADGCQYSINSVDPTDETGLISDGDTITLNLWTPPEFSTQSICIIQIADETFTFSVTTEARDIDPDDFSIEPLADVRVGRFAHSAAIVIEGINDQVSINVEGGSYLLNGDDTLYSSGVVSNDDVVSFIVRAANTFETERTASVMLGSASAVFSVTTEAMDDLPDEIVINDLVDVHVGSTHVIGPFYVAGVNTDVDISIENGLLAVLGRDYTDEVRIISDEDYFNLQVTAPNALGAQSETTLYVGSREISFVVTTEQADRLPNTFTVPSEENAQMLSLVTSDSFVVGGVNVPVDITVENGAYSINEGDFISAPSSVVVGDTVTFQLAAADEYDTTESMRIHIGEFETIFQVLTISQDITPDSVEFSPVSQAELLAEVLSGAVPITGIVDEVSVSVSNGSYSIDDSPYTSEPGVITENQSVSVLVEASDSFGSAVIATLRVGDTDIPFRVTTVEQDTTPDEFAFRDQLYAAPYAHIYSNAQTVSGVNGSVPVTVIGGEYSVDSNDYTSEPGLLTNNQRIRVRHFTPIEEGETTQTTLRVGSYETSFNSTTLEEFSNSAPRARNSMSAQPTEIDNHLNSLEGRIRAMDTGDIDGDGDVDILVSYYAQSGDVGDEGLSWLENSGGPFARFTPHWIQTGSDSAQVMLSDLDNDGDLDFVNRAVGTNILSYYENVRQPTPTFRQLAFDKYDSLQSGQFTIVDLNSDGRDDIVHIGPMEADRAAVYMIENLSDGAFGFSRYVIASDEGFRYKALAAGDLDGDNDPDLALIDFDSASRITMLENRLNEQAEFNQVEITAGIESARFFDLSIGNVDQDGLADIVVTDYDQKLLRVYLNDATLPGQLRLASSRISTGSEPRQVQIVDMDQDGDGDFVMDRFTSVRWSNQLDQLAWFENTGLYDGLKLATTTHRISTDYGWPLVTAKDITGDGVFELLTSRATDPRSDDTRPQLTWYPTSDVAVGAELGQLNTYDLSTYIVDSNSNPIEFSVWGGPDALRFSIEPGSDELVFDAPLEAEDFDSDGRYLVWVSAFDGFSTARFLIMVTTAR